MMMSPLASRRGRRVMRRRQDQSGCGDSHTSGSIGVVTRIGRKDSRRAGSWETGYEIEAVAIEFAVASDPWPL